MKKIICLITCSLWFTLQFGQGYQDSLPGTIEPLDINTAQSDICPVMFEDGLVFASSRKYGFFSWLQSNQRPYDLYYVKQKNPFTFHNPQKMKGSLSSRHHDGPASFISQVLKTAYSTKSRYNPNQENLLKIIETWNWSGKWKKGAELFRTQYPCSNFHPALSPDGEIIVFSSDRPGGYGGMDLYFAQKELGKWGIPENCGPLINSPENELFPFLDSAQCLFFASSRKGGKGGLDLYAAEASQNTWKSPVLLPAPVNSPADDFGICWNSNRQYGWFTSNREQSTSDDLFFFRPRIPVTLILQDTLSGRPLNQARIRLLRHNGQVESLRTDKEGKTTFHVASERDFFLSLDHDEYHKKSLPPQQFKFVFTESPPIIEALLSPIQRFKLTGIIKDKSTGIPLSKGKLFLTCQGGKDSLSFPPDDKGQFSLSLKPNQEYFLIAEAESYISQVIPFNTQPNAKTEQNVSIEMEQGKFILIEGSVINKSNAGPLSGVTLIAMNNHTRTEIDTIESDTHGKFWISIPIDSMPFYSVIASHSGFFSMRMDVDDQNGTQNRVKLEMEVAEYGEGVLIKTIYYEYNTSSLNLLSKKDLNELYYFLIHNPNTLLELGAHTDSRGGDAFNLKLSKKRAQSVVEFILERKQIPSKRLSAKGYGETKLVNDCDDHDECGEDAHSLNRRTEIRVYELSHYRSLQY